ncbi:AbrB/MazE/SpoVT family DNA-binding domain-containing protein [Sphingomonas sp. SUN039]|uniref:AbrB/MazE/SpoVT family DNA-binding domain-containing protein n=1 Tax=Sphingomonas sp. SUN039 TaxID=2937787 RepID=UPI00216488D8|nr:AbrB/MazE/SpoVT family DNA-binding domain-containing protein [Sphingomonas sp. SUN039]UVO54002.1 AbrB/MazE/SpoVT family DNA-binding domain-containing protein [Sphingomonas sp. SUN039]
MGIELKIAANGRIVIPRDVRRALGVEKGGTLILDNDGSKFSLQSRTQRVTEARAIAAAAFAGYQGDPLDDFLKDRAEQRIRERERAENR